jgi:group I intron endonuclease
MAIEVRLREHRAHLRDGKHHCVRLQRAFLKYGEDAFTFEMVKEIPTAELDLAEQALLDEGFSSGNLYNTAKCAEAPARGAKHSEERKAQASAYRKKLFEDPEYLAKHIATIRAGMTAEVRARMSAAARSDSKGRGERMKERRSLWQQNGTMAKAMAKRGLNEGWKSKVREHGQGWRSDLAAVAAHDKAIAARSANPEWQKSMRERNRKMSTDPKWKAAILAGHGTEAARARYRKATARKWCDPSYREKTSKAIRASRRTPEAKARQAEINRARWSALKEDPIRYAAYRLECSKRELARRDACLQ